MNFDLKQPCNDCPFIKNGRMHNSLGEGRMSEIVEYVRDDRTFECHKTVYNNNVEAQHCAGALLFMEQSSERPNQPMRIAERLGLYDHNKLTTKDIGIITSSDYPKKQLTDAERRYQTYEKTKKQIEKINQLFPKSNS